MQKLLSGMIFQNDIFARLVLEVCGDRLDTASIVYELRKCLLVHVHIVVCARFSFAIRPDRTAEVHQHRGLNIFANLIANASVDARSVENIIACLVSMTNTTLWN